MKNVLPLLLFGALLTVSSLQAQSSITAQNSVAVRYIGTNYQWPLGNDDGFDTQDFSGGLEVEYYRSLNKRFDLSFPLRVYSNFLPTAADGTTQKRNGNLGLNALLNFNLTNGRIFRPHLFAGVGTVWEDFEDFSLDVPVGLGLNFALGSNAYLSATGAYRLSGTELRDHLQAGLGLRLMLNGDPAPKAPKANDDRDGDGVPDAQDLCPDVAGPAALYGCPDRDGDNVPDANDDCPDLTGLAALRGCPDADADGIADKDDKCPSQAGPASNMGCPITDRDGDGVADANDQCPDLAGTSALYGCPDRDRDGVADKDDECPNQAGKIADRGCPDTDGDGIVDRLDACPNEPGLAVNKGCPELAAADRATLVEAVQAVEFETASAVIRTSSYAILDKVADILQRYPGYKVRIGGHTDSIGEAPANQSLSEKRAKACYDYLLTKGVAASRMSHQGYGETQPIADNRYAPGRDKNRRVEFDVYIE